MSTEDLDALEQLAKKHNGIVTIQTRELLRLVALARSETVLRGAVQSILEQPFDGSWDAQARFCCEVIANTKRIKDRL